MRGNRPVPSHRSAQRPSTTMRLATGAGRIRAPALPPERKTRPKTWPCIATDATRSCGRAKLAPPKPRPSTEQARQELGVDVAAADDGDGHRARLQLLERRVDESARAFGHD